MRRGLIKRVCLEVTGKGSNLVLKQTRSLFRIRLLLFLII